LDLSAKFSPGPIISCWLSRLILEPADPAMRLHEENLLESYLRSLDAPVTDLISACNDASALRTFACRCARTAMESTKVENEGMDRILSIAEAYINGTSDRAQLDAAATEAEKLVNLFEAEEGRLFDTELSGQAFDAARVAYAVYACTAQSARCAAAFACYEAETALNTSLNPQMREKIDQMAMELLQPSASP